MIKEEGEKKGKKSDNDDGYEDIDDNSDADVDPYNHNFFYCYE